jgi:hypothetical protein
MSNPEIIKPKRGRPKKIKIIVKPVPQENMKEKKDIIITFD